MKNRHLVVSVWYKEGTGSEVAVTKTVVCFLVSGFRSASRHQVSEDQCYGDYKK